VATKTKDLRRKTNRLKLKPQRNPYWSEISAGLHLGYRRIDGKAGRWVGRERMPNGKYRESAIGVADDFEDADGVEVLDHDQAAAKARPSVTAARAAVRTLHEAVDEWLAFKDATSKPATRAHNTWMAGQMKAAFGDIPLAKMTKRTIESWHLGMVKPGAGERSSRAAADRRLATLLAVLNRAAEANMTEKMSRPWVGVRTFGKKLAGEARAMRFTPEQIAALLSALDDMGNTHFKRFVILSLETGCRPSELYTARVRDWDAPMLSVDGKTGRRSFRVSPQAAAVLAECAAGRNDPDAPLLLRHDGKPWSGLQGDLRKLFRRAAARAGLPDESSLYTCRPTFISGALEKGANPAMLAQYAGTSVAIIQESYAKFLPSYVDGLIGGLT